MFFTPQEDDSSDVNSVCLCWSPVNLCLAFEMPVSQLAVVLFVLLKFRDCWHDASHQCITIADRTDASFGFNKNQPQGYLFFFLSAVQTSGAVHVLPQTSVRFPTKNPRLLWAPLPGQDVWWRKHPGGTERAAQRGELVFGYLCVCKGLSMSVNICGKKTPRRPCSCHRAFRNNKTTLNGEQLPN